MTPEHRFQHQPAASDESEAQVLRRLMKTRFSCRAFRDEPVSDAVIGEIIETARWTASWSNVQPWEIIVTRPETTRALSEALLAAAKSGEVHSDFPFPRSFTGATLARRREVGFGLYEALSIRREDRHARHEHHLNNFRFFNAPHVVLVTIPEELGPYGALDCGAFVSSFLLAARALGVDTLAQAALAQHADVVRDFFGIPDDRLFVCGISFGYAQQDHPANRFRSTRIAPAEFVRFA